jgi:hypothetical protein
VGLSWWILDKKLPGMGSKPENLVAPKHKIMILCITTFGLLPFSIMTLGMKTLSIMQLNEGGYYDCNAKCRHLDSLVSVCSVSLY